MKKNLVIAFLITAIPFTSFSQSQVNDKLIELGKAYRDFMFQNDPPKKCY